LMGRILVKVMSGDEGAHRLGNEIADGLAACNPPPDFGGGDVHAAFQASKPAFAWVGNFATPEHDEFHQPAQVIVAAPGVQFPQVISADQIEELRLRMNGANAFHRVDGEARAVAVEFGIIEREARLAGDGGREHFPAHAGRSRGGGELVRGQAGRYENDPIELELLEGLAGQEKMAVVHRIETAAVERETHFWESIMDESRFRTCRRDANGAVRANNG